MDANDWVQDRLDEWADWCRGSWMNGWNTESSYCKERGAKAFQEMSESVGVTDRAVARVKLQSRRFWKALRLKYLRRMGPREIALEFRVDNAQHIIGGAEAAVGIQIELLENLTSSVEYGELRVGMFR